LKVLILRFSSIGDIVLTTPVIRCVKKQLNCEVHFATKKSFTSLLESNSYIDKVIPLQNSFSAFIKELKKEKYDFIIDLHSNLRTKRVKLALRTKSSSFDKLNYTKWKLVKLKKNHLPDIHIVDRYLETVQKLGVKNDKEGLDYFIPAGQEYKKDLPINYEVYAIGGQHATKQLPMNRIIEYCKKQEAPIILLGGKEDINIGELIENACPKVTSLCGKTSLGNSASIIKYSKKVHTHDTGMMHIAAAFNKPIVSIWGNTVPEFGMYPYYKDQEEPVGSKILEVKGLSCRPCSKIGFNVCPKGHFKCMNDIQF